MHTDDLAKILWEFNQPKQLLQKVDCILALGSNDIRVAHRAAELFLDGYAPLLIFSGNVGRLTEGVFNRPEAELFAQEAIKLGVPKEKILIENKSTNTGENLRFTKKLLEEKRIDPQSFMLVQMPFMLPRAQATFQMVFPNKEVIGAAPTLSFEKYPNEMFSKEDVIILMVGEIQRLKLYPARGYQVPVEISEHIWQAYEELVASGYTKYLLEE